MLNPRLTISITVPLGFSLTLFAQRGHLQYFGLDQVELLESPLSQARETSKKYILKMDVDRLLAPYMKEAGIA